MNGFDANYRSVAEVDEEPRPPAFTDEALALRFADTHAGNLRYVAGWGKWLVYDGRRWALDDALKHFDFARKICRSAAAECNKPKLSSALASAKTVAAVVTLARADRRLAATVDQWDVDPWLLNTPTGVLDLRNGTCRSHDPLSYLTKITAVGIGRDCPLWLKFLHRVTAGDAQLVAFLRRAVGYSLTGITREHAMFFLHGTGANGKSVFITTVASVLADYHRSAPIETFTASSVERHPTDLAGLRGARLVTAVETEEGRRWAESKIKSLTGADKIAARFMRQDFFEYVPQFKLMVAGNHKPGLRSVDEAIRRRLHLIPFAVTIPEHDRDDRLAEKLKAEGPGILGWAIGGCLEWQRLGLCPPDVVKNATEEYLKSEDALAAWIEEMCERREWELTARLYASWKAWAERSGEHPGTLKRFRQQLEDRGFLPIRKHEGRSFEGLRLLNDQMLPSEPHWNN